MHFKELVDKYLKQANIPLNYKPTKIQLKSA